MYRRRSNRHTTHRQTRRFGLFAFLRRPIVQLSILALAALVVALILFSSRLR